MLELLIAGLFGHRKANLGDDLAIFKRRGEQPVKEIIRRDLAIAGDDCRARAKNRRRITGRGVIIGQAAADGATIAHRRITDMTGKIGKRRIGPHPGGDIGVACTAANAKAAVIGRANPLHLGNPGQADKFGRRRKALFKRRDKGLPPAKRLCLFVAECAQRITDGGRALDIKCIHAVSPYPCIAAQTREGLRGMSIWVTFLPPDCSASITALTTAGGLPMAPASPQPFTPNGLWVQGVWQE